MEKDDRFTVVNHLGWNHMWQFEDALLRHCPGLHLEPLVRREAPASEKKILIELHLGDLTEATGTVITEFSPVVVSWKKSGTQWQFEI